MVKILLDPSMYHPHLTVAEELQKAADLAHVGNRYIVKPPGVDARTHQHNEIGNSRGAVMGPGVGKVIFHLSVLP